MYSLFFVLIESFKAVVSHGNLLLYSRFHFSDRKVFIKHFNNITVKKTERIFTIRNIIDNRPLKVNNCISKCIHVDFIYFAHQKELICIVGLVVVVVRDIKNWVMVSDISDEYTLIHGSIYMVTVGIYMIDQSSTFLSNSCWATYKWWIHQNIECLRNH